MIARFPLSALWNSLLSKTEVNVKVKKTFSMWINHTVRHLIKGVTNGPWKTIGKFSLNFIEFLAVMCFSQSWIFCKTNKAPIAFYKWCLNILEPEYLKLTLKTLWSLSPAIEEVKISWLSMKNASPTFMETVLHLSSFSPPLLKATHAGVVLLCGTNILFCW